MNAKKLTALMFGLLLVTSNPVLAGDHGHKDGGPDAAFLHKALKGLDLTEAQKTQIKALREAARSQQPSRGDMASQHEALAALVKAPQFDAVAARQLLEAKQDKQLEAQLTRLKLQHDIRAVLTDEQKAKLDARHAKMLERRHSAKE